jgi:hypothetical protein
MVNTIAVSIGLLLSTMGLSWACHMTFEPEAIEGNVGDEVQVTVRVQLEHRRCELSPEDTILDMEGIHLIQDSGWEQVQRGLYENTLTIALDTPGEGHLRVYRECTRKGLSEGIAPVHITWSDDGAIRIIHQHAMALLDALGEGNEDPSEVHLEALKSLYVASEGHPGLRSELEGMLVEVETKQWSALADRVEKLASSSLQDVEE